MTKHASLADKAFGYHDPVRYLASALDDKVIRDYIHADFDRVFLARNYRAVTQTGNTLYLAIRTDIDIDNMHRVEDFDILADDAKGVNATLRTKSRAFRRRCRAKEMMTESI